MTLGYLIFNLILSVLLLVRGYCLVNYKNFNSNYLKNKKNRISKVKSDSYKDKLMINEGKLSYFIGFILLFAPALEFYVGSFMDLILALVIISAFIFKMLYNKSLFKKLQTK